MKMKKLLIIILLLVLLAGVSIYAYKEYNRKVKSLVNAAPDFETYDTALIAEFISTEEQSNKKYSGKTILVTGNVTSLDTSSGQITISLGDNGNPYSVKCRLDSTQPTITTGIGSVISLKGLFIGFNKDTLIGSDVLLNKCVIVHDK